MDAGKINREWLDGARLNEADDDTVENWFERVLNVDRVEIDDDGSVAIAPPWSSGMEWLSQDRIDEACRRIDEGV